MAPSVPITASFCFGTQELYDWVDRNPRVRMLRTEKTNDPALIARHERLMSINGALQVDLFAQANASRVGKRIYSGFGGQTDFIVGAMHSTGGQSFIHATDLNQVLQEIETDTSRFYLLSYVPPGPEGDGEYHEIRTTTPFSVKSRSSPVSAKSCQPRRMESVGRDARALAGD